MSLIVGSARIDENGNLKNGKAGDQTGKEVCTQSYYMHKKGWYVMRAKSVAHANALATAMKQACDNNKIGYDQNERNGVITQLNKYGSLSKIATNTECDCSSLVRACIIQATGKDVGNMTTANLATTLEKSDLFDAKKNVTGEGMLYNGDILVTKTKGHTVIVTSGRSGGGATTSITTTAKPSVTMPSSNTYDPWVYRLQVTLNKLGYRDYEGKKLKEDGMFGTRTLSACPLLKIGAKGELVGLVQERLVKVGFSLKIDKDFGSTTKSKVKKFQANRGLQADGDIGKKTWPFLLTGKSV